MTAVDETFDADEQVDEEYATPVGHAAAYAPGLPRLTEYVPYAPRPKQRAFLCLRCKEAFYGGAAGSGKSDAFLMAALQFADVPNYSALILRKTYQDLSLPGALMHRSRLWLDSTDARWSSAEHAWYFPGGGQLTFGYCEHDADVQRYRSAEFQAIFIDESTQWSEYSYRFMFSRLRKPDFPGQPAPDGLTLDRVPLRMRAASNPGDVGHAWNKRRFIEPATRRRGCIYIPARLEDMAGIVNVEAYTAMLREQDPVNWQRLRFGNWDVRDPGELFDAANINLVEQGFGDDPRRYKRVRYWDMASTELGVNNDPDYAVGLRLALDKEKGTWCIEHITRLRGEPHAVEAAMIRTAEIDGPHVPIRVEQEPGSEGKAYIAYLRRHVLRGYSLDGDRPTGPKETRIAMLEPIVNRKDVYAVLGPWTQSFLDEIDAYPHVDHDDQADALAGAHRYLSASRGRLIV